MSTTLTATRSPMPLDATADTDESLVQRVAAGDEPALTELLRRFRPFVAGQVRSYFVPGADRQDVIQEGMIGLYKAIRDFDPTMQPSFKGFASLCVKRQVMTAIKGAGRLKHGPLNSYAPLDAPRGRDGDSPRLEETLALDGADPVDHVVSSEELQRLQTILLHVLSELEVEVLNRYVSGASYREIADALDRHTKAIDNAVQRIRRKLAAHLEELRAAESLAS